MRISALIRSHGLGLKNLYVTVCMCLSLHFPISVSIPEYMVFILLSFCVLLLNTSSHCARKGWWLLTTGNTFFSPHWNLQGSSAWDGWTKGKQGSQAASIKLNAVPKDPGFSDFQKAVSQPPSQTPRGLASYTLGRKGWREQDTILLAVVWLAEVHISGKSWPWKTGMQFFQSV